MKTALRHYEYACDHWKNEKREEAIAELKQALQLDPNYREALFNLGCMYGVMNCYEEALKEFRLLLQINPNDAVTHKSIGKLFRQKAQSSNSRQDWESAHGAIQQSLNLNPNDAEALDELAIILNELGDFMNAIRSSMVATTLAPKDRRIVRNLDAIGGNILRKYLTQRRWKEAWEFWKEVGQFWKMNRKSRKQK